MDHWTDEELYREIVTGDKEASFRVLYNRYSGPLFRFIYRFTTSRESAEELLHDIFIQLIDGKLELDSATQVKSWLFTVAKNKSLNYIKKSSREVHSETHVQNAVDAGDIENDFQEKNILNRLLVAEKSLPADLSQTWQLRKNGMDYQQIADTLAIPVGTVKSRFSRLVEFLKKELI
jgi:RNA polymerase sigma-70 factor, ECF subfamily